MILNKKMAKSLSAVIATLCLQSCVAAFVAGATIGGLVVYDKRSLFTMRDDQNIREKIHTMIVRNKLFRNSHIIVSSFHRDVLLAGQTPHASLRVTAEKIARSVAKVKRIYNEIEISSPSSMITRSSDTWITTKVKADLLATKGLTSGALKVISENGTVYLMGKVSRAQANMAVNVARRVDGVQRVVKVFRYTD